MYRIKVLKNFEDAKSIKAEWDKIVYDNNLDISLTFSWALALWKTHINQKEVILLPEGKHVEGFESQPALEMNQRGAKRYPKDKIEEIEVELQKFRDEEFNLNFKRFNEKVLQTAFKNKKLDGVDITPLFGLLID